MVQLAVIESPDVENAMVQFQATLRTKDVSGKAYLEMWCRLPGKGEFFSRGLHSAATGTTPWTHLSTPFRLESGQNPDRIRLNLVIEGEGEVWVNALRVTATPLP